MRFLAHLTPTLSELSDLPFLSESQIFVDAPPIPCLVDLVHALNGVVVEQFKKKLEKLFSDSILLWRLLRLLFKIVQNNWKFFSSSHLVGFCYQLLFFERSSESITCIPGETAGSQKLRKSLSASPSDISCGATCGRCRQFCSHHFYNWRCKIELECKWTF